MQLDSVNDYVRVGNISLLNDSVPYSIAAWVNVRSNTTQQTIVADGGSQSAQGGNFTTVLYLGTTGEVVFSVAHAQSWDARKSTQGKYGKIGEKLGKK